MTIKFEYPQIVLDKMKRYVDEAFEKFPCERARPRGKDLNKEAREEYVHQKCGMGLVYLQSCLRGKFREPSGRVLKNMGIVIHAEDLATKQVQQVEFMGRCEIDHSQPTNPRFISD